MAKKKDEDTVEAEEEDARISPLTIELGRDDLNELVAKINELVENINNK